MTIITISRGSFSHGKEIAEMVAEKLGYECISREVLIEASEFFNVPEMKLTKSIHDAPGILERLTHGRDQYISYIRAALLEHVKNDNVVYHGHAGHLLMPELGNVLKVRILADLKDRVAVLRERKNMSDKEAIDFINKEDKQRAMWTKYLYNVEITDPKLYDLIIRIGKLSLKDACDIICTAAQSPSFQLSAEEKRALRDLAITSHAEAALRPICEAEVSAHDGVLYVKIKGEKIRKTGYTSPQVEAEIQQQIRDDLTRQVVQVLQKIPDVVNIECDVDTPYYS